MTGGPLREFVEPPPPPAVLNTRSLAGTETVTRPAALGGAKVELPPFEPPEKVLWAFKRGLTAAVGADGVDRVLAALPGAGDADEIALGVLAGVGDAVQDVVNEHVQLARSGLEALLEFYVLAYDPSVFLELLKVWTADVGSGLGGVLDEVKADHPEVAAALTSFGPFARGINRFVASLVDDSPVSGMPWSAAHVAVAEWMAGLPVALGAMLRPSVEQLVAYAGKAREQGRVIGHVVGRLIVEVVMVACDLYGLVRGAAGVARELLVAVKSALPQAELAAVLLMLEKKVPGLAAAGKDVAKASAEAVKIYQRLAMEIAPYRQLKRSTAAFNKKVRGITGLALKDAEYVGLRLDAHHIVEDDWYKGFAADFEKAFGWKSVEDMDSIALHTELHIRSGTGLAELGLLGAEKEKSLTDAIRKFLAARQVGPNGVAQPFTNLHQLFGAYEDFYRSYSSRIWATRLEKWFAEAKTKLAVLPP